MNEIYKLVSQMPEEELKRTGLKKGDLTECSEILRQAYASEKAFDRRGLLGFGKDTMMGYLGKDGFYTKSYNEAL